MGGSTLHGLQAVAEAARQLGDQNPVAHLVTNTVVSVEGDRVVARSTCLGVRRDGTVGSGADDDQPRRTDDGWRISRRSVSLRREPLQP